MSFCLREHRDAADFLEAAEAHLLANESENSLPLGLGRRSMAGTHDGDLGTRFFTVWEDQELHGCVMQTPGRAAVFTALPEGAAEYVAEQLPEALEALVGCNGPVSVVDPVAKVWETLGLGKLEEHASLRLFELTELIEPRRAPGGMRKASAEDYELCRRWQHRFAIDCRLPEADAAELPERVHSIEQGRLYLWEVDGVPVASATWVRPVQTGITVGFVYTPDDCRGRGYATNLVADLTRGLLDGSVYQPARERVTLFTDLANPTSNGIYRKLGYRPIADHRLYLFR